MIPSPFRLLINDKHPFIGKKQYGNWAVFITKPSDQPQWAVRVSKRIDKRAVFRNTLKRQLNHWLYRHASQLKSQQTLIIFRRKPDKADLLVVFDELKQNCFSPS